MEQTVESKADAATNGCDFAKELLAIGTNVAAVLATLNQVTAEKRLTILGLAAQAAQNPLPAQAQAETSPALADATKRAEQAIADLNTSAPPSPIHFVEHAAAQAISMALHNTVATNQQLDILAQAVLAKAAAILLSSGKQGA